MSNQITDWQSGRNATAANQYMLENKLGTDVKFIFKHVDEDGGMPTTTVVVAHKYILVSRSSVFFTMFYGSFQETGEGIEIMDIEPHIFEDMLRFMYTDKIQLTNDTALDMLYAANKYQITNLTKECKKFLISNMTKDNVIVILNNAIFYAHTSLKKKCLNFIKDQVHQDATCLSQHHVTRETLEAILDDKELAFHEKDLFEYCYQWAAQECSKSQLEPTGENQRKILGPLLYKIRMANISSQDIASVVTPSEVLTSQEELSLYRYINHAKGSTIPFTTGKRMPVFVVESKGTLNGRNINVTSYTGWQICGLIYGQSDRDVQKHITINDNDYIKVKIEPTFIMLPPEEHRTLKDSTVSLSLDISRANRIDMRIYKVGTVPHERVECDKWPANELGTLRYYRFEPKKSFIEGLVFRRRLAKKSHKKNAAASEKSKAEVSDSPPVEDGGTIIQSPSQSGQ